MPHYNGLALGLLIAILLVVLLLLFGVNFD